MFIVVCAVFSSFQLLGPWFESIGFTEVDRNRVLLVLLLLQVEVVVAGVAFGTSRTARVVPPKASAGARSASAILGLNMMSGWFQHLKAAL